MRMMVIATIVCLAMISASRAEDAQQVYNSLFRQQEPSPRQREESAAFAAKLLRYAEGLQEDTRLKLMLLQKACEFGLRDPSGYPTSISAMKLMADVDPLQKEYAQKQVVDIYRRQYREAPPSRRRDAGQLLLGELVRAGDQWFESEVWYQARRVYEEALAVASAIGSDERGEIEAKLQQVRRVGGKALLLQDALKRATKQSEARQLVMIYLFDLDDAAEAANWVGRAQDEALARRVALANKHWTQLTESESLELALWYQEQARESGTTDYSRRVRLRGVVRCYEQYMSVHPARDAAFLKAKAAAENAREELETMRGPSRGTRDDQG